MFTHFFFKLWMCFSLKKGTKLREKRYNNYNNYAHTHIARKVEKRRRNRAKIKLIMSRRNDICVCVIKLFDVCMIWQRKIYETTKNKKVEMRAKVFQIIYIINGWWCMVDKTGGDHQLLVNNILRFQIVSSFYIQI